MRHWQVALARLLPPARGSESSASARHARGGRGGIARAKPGCALGQEYGAMIMMIVRSCVIMA